MPSKEEAAAHYKKELEYYKSILQLKNQAADGKSSFIFRIKQLEGDKHRLEKEDGKHKHAIELLKRENAVIKKELEAYRSKLDDNESQFDSSPKKSVADASEDIELRKTLQFKSKFRGTDAASLSPETRRKNSKEEYLINIFDGNVPNLKGNLSLEPPKEKLERSTSHRNISLVELPPTDAQRHRRNASETVLEVNTVHGNPNTKLDLSSSRFKIEKRTFDQVRLNINRVESEEEVAISRESSRNSQQEDNLRSSNDDTFYKNYLKLGQRIKELNQEIEASRLPPLQSSPRKSWLSQQSKPSIKTKSHKQSIKHMKAILVPDHIYDLQTVSPRKLSKGLFLQPNPRAGAGYEYSEEDYKGKFKRENSHEVFINKPFQGANLESRSVGIGRSDPLKSKFLIPLKSSREREDANPFTSKNEALLEYEKFKKSLQERSKSSFRSHAKLEKRPLLEPNRVSRLRKLYQLEP